MPILFSGQKAGGNYPAIIVELKWNKSENAAIEQIKERKYQQALSGYKGDILLVGVSYHTKTKKHTCAIEKAAAGKIS